MDPWPELLANLAIVAIATSTWTFVRPYIEDRCGSLLSLVFGTMMTFGLVAAMTLPFHFNPGVYLDTRYTFLAIAGFFGGPVASVLPLVAAIIRRLLIGGVGISVGIPQILAASLIGLVGYWAHRGRPTSTAVLVGLAACVALSGVTGFFIVRPIETWGRLMVDTVGPFSAVLFGATLLSTFAITQELRRNAVTAENRVYRAIIEALPDPLNAKDNTGRFVAANPATAEIMGVASADELIGKTDFDFYPNEVATSFRAPEIEVANTLQERRVEQKFTRPDGNITWLGTLKAPLIDNSGKMLGVITHNREITERKRLEGELSAARARLDDALATMADGLALFDTRGILVFANQRYLDLFPITADVRTPGASIRDILRASMERREEITSDTNVDARVEKIAASLFVPGDRVIELADGRSIEARTRVTGEGEAMIVYSDVTLHRQRESRLHELNDRLSALADTDELTGLMNRRAFEAAMDQAFEVAQKHGTDVGLLLIDVDRFKAYNDTYGHLAGDVCLRAVANSIRETCRSFAGSTVARYGGEELTVVLPKANLTEADAIARLICAALRELHIEHVASDKRIVTASIGVASLKTTAGRRKSDLLGLADEALYEAKASGRDCVRVASSSGDEDMRVFDRH